MAVPPEVFASMVRLRRDLHQHPELSWEEQRTSAKVSEELDRLGIPWKRAAKIGVVADLAGSDPGYSGPIVAIRGDMDALPIHEATGLPFASCNAGVMHACGHDGHTSMLVGAAELLLAEPAAVPVRLLFQPAEEMGSGAKALIDDGALDNVAYVFGGHVDRHYPPGQLIVSDGPVNASTDTFSIDISGQQGHGARPHEAVDAIVVGSLLVTALQTIVSREVDPARPSVVTVGSFHAGAAPNVIAGQARLEGTIRAQHPEVRAHLHRSIRRIAVSIGQLHDAAVQVDIIEGTPPLLNDEATAAIARAAAIEVVGADNVGKLHTANMGGEDFAWYLEHVKGCYIRYGAQVPGRESYPAHSSQFDFHEDALGTGAAWLATVARHAGRVLNPG